MFELVVILILIIANGAFAMSEAAIVASRKPRLQQRAEAGDKKAAAALELANNPDRLLSTTQVGITLIGIFSGAFGGATLSKALAEILKKVPSIAAYADSVAFFLVVAAITYFSLIVGELVPKRLALGNPEGIAARVAGPMNWLSKLASPIVVLLSVSTALVFKLLGVKETEESSATDAEIQIMIEHGVGTGSFDAAESEIVGRVFRLGDQSVSALMTRRPDVVWLDARKSWDENAAILGATVYSRLPVGDGDLDHVVGFVSAKHLLAQFTRGETPNLQGALQTPFFVPETMPALRLLEALRQYKTHIAIVVDEFGGTEGVITLHDILEAVVGDLPAVDESDEGYAVRREDGSYLVEALMPLGEFERLFDLDTLPETLDHRVESVSGFILLHLGRIPRVAESFDTAGLHFEIVDMDGQRIDKILVRKVEAESNPPQ